jgi:hypothetical protein
MMTDWPDIVDETEELRAALTEALVYVESFPDESDDDWRERSSLVNRIRKLLKVSELP